MVKFVSFLYASSALGDKLFLFPRGQRISAYTESAGKLTKLWSQKLVAEISSSGSTAGNSCIIGIEEDELISIDFKTGYINWKFQANGYIMFPPIRYRGMLYFAAGDTVYCLSGSGEEVWKNDLGGRINSPLKIDPAQNRVLVTLFNDITIDTQHHDLVCLNAKNGVTFARRMSKKIFRSAVMMGKSNFFVLTAEDLRKFGKGELKATVPAVSKVPPATGEIFGDIDLIQGRIIYQSERGGIVYDVNERKVLLKFAFDIITDVVVCPLLKIFFFGIKEDGVSKVCAVEAESLTVKWTTVMQASLSNKPVLTNEEELIISTEEGHVLAVNSENGKIIWQSKVASDNLYGIVLHEDNVDPRCQSSSLHVMDEEVLLSRLMDGFDDIESLDDEKAAEQVSEEDEEEIDADDNVHEEL